MQSRLGERPLEYAARRSGKLVSRAASYTLLIGLSCSDSMDDVHSCFLLPQVRKFIIREQPLLACQTGEQSNKLCYSGYPAL